MKRSRWIPLTMIVGVGTAAFLCQALTKQLQYPGDCAYDLGYVRAGRMCAYLRNALPRTRVVRTWAATAERPVAINRKGDRFAYCPVEYSNGDAHYSISIRSYTTDAVVATIPGLRPQSLSFSNCGRSLAILGCTAVPDGMGGPLALYVWDREHVGVRLVPLSENGAFSHVMFWDWPHPMSWSGAEAVITEIAPNRIVAISVADGAVTNIAEGRAPALSPDGQFLYFIADDQVLLRNLATDCEYVLHTALADFSNSAVWAEDSRYLAYFDRSPWGSRYPYRVCIMRVEDRTTFVVAPCDSWHRDLVFCNDSEQR